jgi:hypothetical protein
MNALYTLARQSFLAGSPAIDWDADTIKATLIDTAQYTVNLTTHQYMNTNTVPAIAKLGTVTLTATAASGIANASNLTFTSVTGTVGAIILWKDGGGGGTTSSGTNDILIAYIDGRQQLTIAANASSGGTAITFDACVGAIASGVTLTKISGTGPSTITSNGTASAGGRSLTVTSLGSNTNADAIYEVAVSGSGLPVTLSGGNLNVNWDTGTNKIFKL